MSSSKSRRRVTVDQEPLARSSDSLSEKRNKRSVFQRLGSVPAEVCHLWISTGHCNYGSSCKFSHPASAIRTSKEGNDRERSPDDLRQRMPRKRDPSESDNEESRPKKRDRSERQSKEGKAVKSAVVVGKTGRDSDYELPLEQPEDSDLDMDSTRLLMKKRLQLQQQLNELEEAEKAEQDDPVSPSANRPKHAPEEVLDEMYRQKPRERFLEDDPLHRHKPKDKKKKKRKEKLRRSDPLLEEVDDFAGVGIKRRHSRDQPKGKARTPELKKAGRPSRSRSPHVKKKTPKKKRESGEMERKPWTPKKDDNTKRMSLSPRGKAAKQLKHERKRSLSPERRKAAEGVRSSRGRAREGARRKSSTTSSTSSSSSSSSSSSTSGSSSSSSSSASSRERLKKKGLRKMMPKESVKGRSHKALPPSLRQEEPVRREEEVLVPPPPPPAKEDFRRGSKLDYSKTQRALSPKDGRPKRHERSVDYRDQKKEEPWKRDEVPAKEQNADYQKRPQYDRQYRDEYYQREKERDNKGRDPHDGERDRERAPPREDDRGRDDMRDGMKDADKMRYRDVERTRSREDERMRAGEDPRLRESDRLKAERDLHLYFKEYEQLRMHEHASKYQDVYAAEMARHAEHYDRAAYERYALEARKDDPRLRGADYAQSYSRDERVEAYYRYRRELEEGHRHEDRSRGHDDRRRMDDIGRAVVDDRGRYVDDRGRLLDKREADRARYDDRARVPEERSRHYDGHAVREDPRARGAYPDPAAYPVDERHSRRQHWEERSESHSHHGEQYDERSRAAYSARRRPDETTSPRSANSPSGSLVSGHPDYKRDPEAFRTASQTRDQSWDRRAPRPKEEGGGRGREWEEHHVREPRAPEDEARPRSQPRSGSYDKRRRSSPPSSWDTRDAKRSRKDWSQGDASYNRDTEWPERSTDAAKRGQEAAHRSSSKDRREQHEDRSRRSPSRSSLGSRHSFRDDRYRGDYERNRGEPAVVPPVEDRAAKRDSPKKEIKAEDETTEKTVEEKIEEKEVEAPPKEEVKEEVKDEVKEEVEVEPKPEEVETPVEDTPPVEPEKIEEETPKVIEKPSDEVETVSSNGDLSSQPPEEAMEAAQDGGLSPEYDDISDDDLDELFDKEAEQEKEEARKEVDALGIDWQSLAGGASVAQSADKGALQRFTPAAILTSIGFSEKFAGCAMTNKAKELCHQFFTEGKKQDDDDAKSEVTVHLSGVKRAGHRENVLRDVGMARRALCARRDLHLRRTLCKVDKFPEGFVLYPLPIVDQELYKQSLALFQQNRQVNSEKTAVA